MQPAMTEQSEGLEPKRFDETEIIDMKKVSEEYKKIYGVDAINIHPKEVTVSPGTVNQSEPPIHKEPEIDMSTTQQIDMKAVGQEFKRIYGFDIGSRPSKPTRIQTLLGKIGLKK
jgi:hypothetical protein